MTTSPDEKRPYSTAYGFGSTATESIASSGSETCVRPVDGIDERAGAELHARLAGTSALDADAARHFDDARQQPQRRLKAAARRELFEFLPPIASLSASVPSLDTMAADPTTSTVCEIAAIGRSSDRQCWYRRRRSRSAARRLEPGERGRHAIAALGQRDDAEVAVALAQAPSRPGVRPHPARRSARRPGESCRPASSPRRRSSPARGRRAACATAGVADRRIATRNATAFAIILRGCFHCKPAIQ